MRKALGRGLNALIPPSPSQAEALSSAGGNTIKVALSNIHPNRLQPRRHFDAERLSELAATIKEYGLAQPLIVSPMGNGEYELIAGERRLRACELAGLKEVEIVIRHPKTDKDRLAIALIENLQREGLNAIETALGYLRLMKEFGINQTELGQVVGKSKASISNTLRLLDLPEEMQKMILVGKLTEGHGRALLSIENILERQRLFKLSLEQDFSVRSFEDAARRINSGQPLGQPAPRPQLEKSADLKALEATLQHFLGTKVEIKTKKDLTKGTVTIHFFSLDEFEKIVQIIKK
jgi:ParB family chromosome partitioning protein